MVFWQHPSSRAAAVFHENLPALRTGGFTGRYYPACTIIFYRLKEETHQRAAHSFSNAAQPVQTARDTCIFHSSDPSAQKDFPDRLEKRMRQIFFPHISLFLLFHILCAGVTGPLLCLVYARIFFHGCCSQDTIKTPVAGVCLTLSVAGKLLQFRAPLSTAPEAEECLHKPL